MSLGNGRKVTSAKIGDLIAFEVFGSWFVAEVTRFQGKKMVVKLFDGTTKTLEPKEEFEELTDKAYLPNKALTKNELDRLNRGDPAFRKQVMKPSAPPAPKPTKPTAPVPQPKKTEDEIIMDRKGPPKMIPDIPANLEKRFEQLNQSAHQLNKVSPVAAKMWFTEMWKWANSAKFGNQLKIPNILLMKMQGIDSFKTRGYWRYSRRELVLSPRLFWSDVQIAAEIVIHEMCITGDTLIPTDLGLVRMDSIKETGARKVLTRKGETRIRKWWCAGERSVLEMTTSLGVSLKLTEDHPVLIYESGSFKWRKAGNLRQGDVVITRFGSCTDRDSVGDLTYAMKSQIGLGRLRTPTPRFPTKMTAKLARLLGYLVAEGSFTEGSNPNTIDFSNGDPDVIKDFLDCWESCFGFTPSQRTYKGSHVVGIYSGRKDLAAWIEAVGFNRCKSPERSVPFSVMCASTKHQQHFLRAFIEGDGSIGPRGTLGLYSSSSTLLQQLQQLMLQQDLISKFESRSKGFRHGKGPQYRLRVFDGLKAVRTIGAISEKRKEILTGVFAYHANKTQNQLGKHWKIPDAYSVLYDLSTRVAKQIGSLERGQMYPHQLSNALTRLRKKDKKKVRNMLGNFIYDKVASITFSGKELVYDMTTDASQFVANGLVIHNCHQATNEISHDFDMSQNGHGPTWRSWMTRVGLNPNRFDHRNNYDHYASEKDKMGHRPFNWLRENGMQKIESWDDLASLPARTEIHWLRIEKGKYTITPVTFLQIKEDSAGTYVSLRVGTQIVRVPLRMNPEFYRKKVGARVPKIPQELLGSFL